MQRCQVWSGERGNAWVCAFVTSNQHVSPNAAGRKPTPDTYPGGAVEEAGRREVTRFQVVVIVTAVVVRQVIAAPGGVTQA